MGRGFHYGGVIQKALDGKKFKKIEEVNSYSQNVKKLLIGRVELMVGNDLNVAFEAKMQNVIDDIEQVTLESTGKPYLLSTPKTYCAFSKKVDKSIVDAVSKALKDMKKDGTYDKLREKYLK